MRRLILPLTIVVLLSLGVAAVPMIIGSRDMTRSIESVSEDEFPARLKREIQLVSVDVESAAFQFAGDFKRKRHGMVAHSRSYLSRDSKTVFEIESTSMHGRDVGKVEMAMTSVLADGTLLQSSPQKELPELLKPVFRSAAIGRPRLILRTAGEADLVKWYRQHQIFLESNVDRFEAEALAINDRTIPSINRFLLDVMDHYVNGRGYKLESPIGQDGVAKQREFAESLQAELNETAN